MPKYVSEWNKTMGDFWFPEGMPEELQNKVIARRRQILTYAYLLFGLGEEDIIGQGMWQRLCNDLQELQAVWGHTFHFYDWMFEDWSIEKEDHLPTNRGIDNGVINHALAILSVRKTNRRRLEAQVERVSA